MQNSSQSVEHVFHELPTQTQTVLTSVVIEVLCLPFGVKDISESFLFALFDNPTGVLKSFAHINAVAMILAALPKAFHQQVYEKALLIAKQDKLMIIPELSKKVRLTNLVLIKQKAFLNPISLVTCTDYLANVSSNVDNNPNKILVLMQQLLHYSSIDNTAIYPQFIREMKPFLTLQQLFWVVKLIAPFMYRISSNPILANEVHLFCITD
jgi:hypothetical protein